MSQMDSHDVKKQILMEAGTNELEILVFSVEGETYGINVAKVREVIRPPKMVKPPNKHHYVLGAFDLRGVVIPAVNVRCWLGYPDRVDNEKDRVIVTEFNDVWFGFWVDAVDRIHRVSWTNIEAPPLETGTDGYVTGVAHIGEKLVLMLDFEKVVFEISPDIKLTDPKYSQDTQLDRSSCKILMAEDSAVMQQLLLNNLKNAGFKEIVVCPHGEAAWDTLLELMKAKKPGESILDHVDLLITDIEMPKMDGLRLTKLVKEHSELNVIPIIIFSSIISHDNFKKGESVGANVQITKPEIGQLVDHVDALILQCRQTV